MSVRSDRTKETANDAVVALGEQATDMALAEGSSYCVAQPDKPLKRQLVVSIRASLDDLCRSRSKSVWSPSSEALKSIFQQKKFTSLAGSAEAQGDLKVRCMPIAHSGPQEHTSAVPWCSKLVSVRAVGGSARHVGHGRQLHVPRWCAAACLHALYTHSVHPAHTASTHWSFNPQPSARASRASTTRPSPPRARPTP